MRLFELKPGPVFTKNNALHAVWGASAVGLGATLGDMTGATYGLVAIGVLGFGWELLNTRFPRGSHMHADMKGYLSFVVPALTTRLMFELFSKGKP
jgi:hypothetical protein